MKRRFKPGDRARVVAGQKNSGKIVVVVRKYRGEEIGGAAWHEEVFPWVVTSLGGLLSCCVHRTRAPLPPVMTIVIDDRDLEPVSDDEDDDLDVDIEAPIEGIWKTLKAQEQAVT
jgi:hypothetical protein